MISSTPSDPQSLIHLEKPQFRPWRDLALLSVMVMEVCWVAPWFRTLTIAAGDVSLLRAFLVLFGMMLGSHLLIRLLFFLRLKTIYRQEIILFLLVICLLAGFKLLLYSQAEISWLEAINRPLKNLADYRIIIPDEFVVFVIIVIAWWRGIALAQDFMGPSTVMSQFATGMVMFVLYVLLVTLGTDIPAPLQPFYLFLFATLVGMTAARISTISTLRGGRQVSFDRRWFIGVMLTALILVLLSFAIMVYGSGVADVIGTILMILIALIAFVLWLFIAPLLYLLTLLLARLPFFRELSTTLLDSIARIVDLGQAVGKYLLDLIEKTGLFPFLARLAPALRLVCLGGGIILLLGGLLFWAAIRLWRDRLRKSIQEERSDLDAAELLKMLREALRRSLAQMRGQALGWMDFRYSQRLRAAARIRQIYASLLDLSAKLKVSRLAAQTPLEYLPSMLALFTEQAIEVELITRAYLRVRYGMLPESAEELQAVEQAWGRVETQGQAFLREQEKKKTHPAPS